MVELYEEQRMPLAEYGCPEETRASRSHTVFEKARIPTRCADPAAFFPVATMATGYKVKKAENRRPQLLGKDAICHHCEQLGACCSKLSDEYKNRLKRSRVTGTATTYIYFSCMSYWSQAVGSSCVKVARTTHGCSQFQKITSANFTSSATLASVYVENTVGCYLTSYLQDT